MKVTKGHYGYLKSRKLRLALVAGILAIGVIGLFVLGYLNFKKAANWLTIAAVISAIPMAMQLATLFSMIKYKGRPEEEYREIREMIGNGILDTEILVPQRDKMESLLFDYVFIHEEGIFIYTSSKKMDLVKTPDYIRNFLRLNSCDGNVRIFTDLKAYKGMLKKLAPSDRDSAAELLLQQEGVIRAICM